MTQSHDSEFDAGGFKPVSTRERIQSIDVVRGIALLGILVVNSLFFAFPLMQAMSPPEATDASGSPILDMIAWWIMSVFFQYKFISLFSLLFGVGAAIQFARAKAAGRPFDLFFIRRLAILLAFGLIHALCFWYGDVLVLYALIGIWLLLLCRLRPKALVAIGIGLLTFGAVLGGGLSTLEGAFQDTPALMELDGATMDVPAGALEAMNSAQWNPQHPNWSAAENRAYGEGPYADLLLFRATTWFFYLLMAAFQFGWHILAMFAFGVAMYKSDFFGEDGNRLRCWAVAAALPAGLLLEVLCALCTVLWQPDLPALIGATTAIHEYSGFLMAFGYAGLITWIVRAGGLRLFAHVAACTGRMALTVYLAETLIMTSAFYFYGGGLFGQVDRFWLLPLSLGVWSALAIFSTLWLANFKQGPMEWLWRCLSYGRIR